MTTAGDPLDGIDAVAWHRLHHAYGPATDVPAQLRALRSPDPARRAKARSHLFGNIYHQGTRWQASHAAVPFLVALVDDPATPERAGVLDLLTAVAIGDRRDDELPFDAQSAFAAADHLAGVDLTDVIRRFYAEDELSDDELGLMDTAAVLWEADCYRGTAAHLPTITAWVADPDDDVAARAAALLPWFPPTAAAVSALVAVPAHRPDVRAAANLALAHSPHADPRIEQRLAQLLADAVHPVAVTAAVALAYRAAAPDDAVSILIDASTEGTDDLPAGIAGWDRAPRGFVMLALRRLGLG